MFRPSPPVILATIVAVALGITGCGGGDDDETGAGTMTLPVTATFYGAEPSDSAAAMASGDFNGDGDTDVALGAAFADGPGNERADAGEVYVFFGPFEDGEERDAGAGEQDLAIYGAAAGDNAGRTLAAGDFDSDGADDLALGAPGAHDRAGAVFVVYGLTARPEGEEIDLAQPLIAVREMRGEDPEDYAGLALAVGALDGDSRADLVVGALLADGPENARVDAGAAYILISPPALEAEAALPLSTAIVIHGAKPGDRLGETVATGDVTGDGRDEAILAAPFADASEERADAGKTYALSALQRPIVDLATDSVELTIVGADAGDQLGHSLTVVSSEYSPPGLWLGAVSADGRDNATNLAGEGVFVRGEPGEGRVVDVREDAAAIVHGPAEEARLGRGAASLDLDGDGLGDLLMTASDVGELRGQLITVLSPERGVAGAISPRERFDGFDTGDYLGTGAFGGPPIVVTGPGQVLVSAAQGDGPDNSRPDCGEAYLLAIDDG